MKHTLKLVIILFVGLTTLLYTARTTPTYAAANEVSFLPSSGTYTAGQEFVVTIYGSYQSNATVIGRVNTNVTVSYPPTVTYVRSSVSGSAISSGSLSSYGNTISFQASESWWGSVGSMSNQKLFTITFRTINPGAVTLDFTQGVIRNITVNRSSGTYSVIAATCPSGQVGTPPNCTTPPPPQPSTPTPNPTPTPSTTTSPAATIPPPIDLSIFEDINNSLESTSTTARTADGDLSIKGVSIKASWRLGTISWSTSIAGTPTTLRLGDSKKTLQPIVDITTQQDGVHTASIVNLEPGKRYFYTISAVPQDQDSAKATYDGSFVAKGYPVTLKITQDNKPLVNAKIAIDNEGTYTTDRNGLVQLTLTDKAYKAIISTPDSTTHKIEFVVAKKPITDDNVGPDKQQFHFTLENNSDAASVTSSPGSTFLLLGISVVGGLVLIGGFFGLLLYRRHKSSENPFYTTVDTDSYSWTSPEQHTYSHSPPQDSSYNTATFYSNQQADIQSTRKDSL
ncbi:MAG: hypothetical protein WAS27_02810 [Candidatus Saccharimonadales bacterium]